jgi:uncharacterized protein (TIGR02594 family)
MPTVPTYLEAANPVELRPQYRQGLTTQANADDFGGQIGRGLEGLASGLGDLGDAVARVQELDNVNAAKEADNNYSAWARNAMYGDGGFMTLEGKAAVDARTKFDQDAAQKRIEFGENLNAGASQHYMDASQSRLNSLLGDSIQHAATQRKAWFNDTSNARMDTFASDALASYKDPAKVNQNMLGGLAELRQQANMHGWDEAVFQQKKAAYVSGISKSIVLQMAIDDPIAADKYMKDAGARLSPEDRMQLTNALDTPLLAAKAERNLAGIIAGNKPPKYDENTDAGGKDPTGGRGGFALAQGGPTRITADNINGAKPFHQVASQLIGLREGTDSAVLSQFIKQSCGLNVDPRVTPWCAAFVNGVLGAEGIKGTGSLAARSFLNFGTATNNPKPGDIVVLGRGGDPSKGHVGFFQGYDANGNILVLGGNQGKDGRVSVSAQRPENLLGFRSAGVVDENVSGLPNYSPQGLQSMQDKLDAITDPKERAATQKALDGYLTVQKKQIDAAREQAQVWANDQLMQNPGMNVMKLPINIQQALGSQGMTALMNFQDKVRTSGQPVTDDHVLLDLQTQYANDPETFAKQDLFQYRDKLSNQDWDKVTAWRQTALTDQRKAKDEGLAVTQAFSQSERQLRGVGLIKEPARCQFSERLERSA